MAKRMTRLCVQVEYDDAVTDSESLGRAFDRLVETALSTPGILEEYGNPYFFECEVEDELTEEEA